MAYVPRWSHLIKMTFGLRDRAAAEGLFYSGSIAFESGELDDARLMFTYGTRLDPTLAGNFYNLAITLEKLKAPVAERRRAWQRYLAAAETDKNQNSDSKERARARLAALDNPPPSASGETP